MSVNQRLVVVDDADSRITYSGVWYEDNSGVHDLGYGGPTYLKTLHGTASNSSLSFSFRGTGIWAYGTTTPFTPGGPLWNCYVDNKIAPLHLPLESANNQVLCSGEHLDDGVHQFTLEVPQSNRTFWFDSLRFAPSLEDSFDSSVLLVDSHDSAIKYGNGWLLSPSPLPALTQRNDSRVQFDFVGTGLTWVGKIPAYYSRIPTSGAYSIDGGRSTPFSLVSPGNNASAEQANLPIFTTPKLSPGLHTIVVTYDGDEAHVPLTLQNIYLFNSSLPASASPTPTPSVENGSPHPSDKQPPLGLILGCVIGGLAFLGTVIAILLLLWKWQPAARRPRLKVLELDPPSPNQSTPSLTSAISKSDLPTPWISSECGSQDNPPNSRQTSRKVASKTLSGMPPLSSVRASPTTPLPETQQAQPRTTQKKANQMGANLEEGHGVDDVVVHHRDSGIRLSHGSEGQIVEVPPTYTPS